MVDSKGVKLRESIMPITPSNNVEAAGIKGSLIL
jgi:hypothetical protein